MANYKVQLGFTHKGKAYAKGDTLHMTQAQAGIYEQSGYIVAHKEPVKKEIKAARGSKKEKATKTDSATTPEATETK